MHIRICTRIHIHVHVHRQHRSHDTEHGCERRAVRADFIAALTDAAGADRDAPIALICAGGVRSARLGRRLTEAGFTNIIDVPEGMQGSGAGPGWLRRGLPTRTYEET